MFNEWVYSILVTHKNVEKNVKNEELKEFLMKWTKMCLNMYMAAVFLFFVLIFYSAFFSWVL